MEKIIKAESAKGKNYIELFNKSRHFSVREFYNNPSSEKIAAENKILQKSELKAYRVLGGNSSTFTASNVFSIYLNLLYAFIINYFHFSVKNCILLGS